MRTIALALACCLTSVCVAEAAELVLVRGTYADAIKSPEAANALTEYELASRDLKAAGLAFTKLGDEQVAAGALSGVKLAIFPYSPKWAPGEAKATASFLRAGGKAIVAYICPPEVLEALGFKPGEYMSAAGRFSACRLTARGKGLAGFPEQLAQHGHSITSASPDRADAFALYDWYNAKGEPSGLPAMLLSDGGAFMTQVLSEAGSPAKSRLLLALAGHFLPHIWAAAARRAITNAWAFSAFSSPDELAGIIAHATRLRRANNPGPAFRRARDLTARARRAVVDKRYTEALALADQARSAAIEAYARCQRSAPVEMRSVWIQNAFGVDNWGWKKSIRHLHDMGFNAIFPCMCWAGVAYYNSKVLPVSPEVAKRGDQLAECLKWCHKYGVECHVWKVNWNLGVNRTPPAFLAKLRREGRLQMNPEGKEINWLCPTDERNFDLERDAMVELVRKYHVDGIHFDYIRYPGMDGCYCPRCRAKFEARIGHKVAHWPADVLTGPLVSQWLQFRRDNINRLVEAVSTEVHRIDPHCQISAAVYGWWESSRDTLAQDWVEWVRKGWLDFVCPMDYVPGNDDLARVVTKNVRWVDGDRPLYVGLGEWLLKDAAHIIYQVNETRDLGADGWLLFHYDHPEFYGNRMAMMHLGATREPALLPHRGPSVKWDLPPSVEQAGPITYVKGTSVEVGARLGSDAPGDAWLELIRLDGRAIEPLGRCGPGSTVEAAFRMKGYPVRLAMTGRDTNGRITFQTRGPIFYPIAPDVYAEQQARNTPPKFTGAGLAVGVYQDSYGGPTILDALRRMPGIDAQSIYSLEPEFLKPCHAVIVPQPKDPAVLSATEDALRAFVEDGGLLLVTHDAVGFRQCPVLVPEVCAGGAGRAEDDRWKLVAKLVGDVGLKLGEIHHHTFWDHVLVTPGPAGKVIATDVHGRPLVVEGSLGKGEFCACGIALGVEREGDRDVQLSDAEAGLLQGLLLGGSH